MGNPAKTYHQVRLSIMGRAGLVHFAAIYAAQHIIACKKSYAVALRERPCERFHKYFTSQFVGLIGNNTNFAMSKGELSGDACRFPSDAALNRIMTLTQIDNFAEYPRHRQPAKAS